MQVKHDELFLQASKLLDGQVLLDNAMPNEIDEGRIKEAIGLLEKVVEINPKNWAAYWEMGKAYQVLDLPDKQYDCFKKSQQIASIKPAETYSDVLRELVFACLILDKYEEATYYSHMAVEFRPGDPGLLANYAICLAMVGRLMEAKKHAETALSRQPDDEVTKHVLKIINDVSSGAVPALKSFRELMND